MIDIPGYKILEELYFGEKSNVYRAEKNGKTVIIKSLQSDYPSISDLSSFRQEYELLKTINNVGIVRIEGVEKYKNSFVIIFEDINGKALSILNKNKKISSLNLFLSIAIKIAKAIGEIHEAKIVHRDIKPHNIVYNENTEEINIIDFGSASLLSRQHAFIPMNTSLEGTLSYISPEQTGRMNRSVDYRTDYYSFGITLYQLLVGECPFVFSDPMELVHAHIAKVPLSPHTKNSTPKPISDIIMKLLEKNPEDRYQNINGILYDLEWCLDKLISQSDYNPISLNESFIVGEKDFSGIFRIPEKLYGRTKEVNEIVNTFKRVTTGNTELLLISGHSGIGKSVLINEVNRPIIECKGYFINGKYDQFKRSIPYRAIASAFTGMIQQILSEKAESIQTWKYKIISALGSNAQVLIDVIPELESLIGPQEPVMQLGIEESQNRFNLVFQSFIEVLSAKEHPLAIFLDDMQWADSPSIKLIQNILSNFEIRYLLIMFSFRDNEVASTDPLFLMLENIKKSGIGYKEISLGPLSLFDIHVLVSETLSCEKERCRELTEILFTKTTGNPFFLNTLFKSLYDKNLIFFTKGKWEWDIEKIREVEISENVIDLVIEKVKELPPNLIEVLKFSACLGSDFNLDIMTQISRKDFQKLTLELEVLSNEGFFIMMENNVRFAHDKVREAIYSLMSYEEKIQTHHLIGNWWLKNTPQRILDENIFQIIAQLNLGKSLLRTLKERLTLIYLNLRAGKKAKISTAYEGALNFLQEAVMLLPIDKWESHYLLTLEIYKEFVECEFLATHFEAADILFEYIFQNTKTLEDKIPIYHIQLRQKAGEGKGEEAFAIGFQVLNELGLKMPDYNDHAEIRDAFIKQLGEYEQLRGQKSIPELIHLPEMKDPNIIEAISLITNLGDIAISLKPEMLGLLSIMGVNLSFKYGNTSVSPISYVMWGVITNYTFLDYKSGYELGQLSIKLNEERFPSGLIFAKVISFYGWNIHHWIHHVKEDLEIAKKGYEIAMANSDLIYGSYLIAMSFFASFYIGHSLDDVLIYANKALSFSEKYKQPFLKVLVTSNLRILFALQGKTEANNSFADSDFREDQFIIENEKFGQPMAYFYLRKLQLYFLYGEFSKCIEVLPLAEKYFPNIPHHIAFSEFHFYNALTLINVMEDFPLEKKKIYKTKLEESMDFFDQWASFCEDNFQHQNLLLKAEKAKMLGNDLEAMQLYDKSIASAKKFDYKNNAAIANELAAKYYFSKGLEKIANLYMREAHYLYELWGATAKVKQLEEIYTQLKKQPQHSYDYESSIHSTSTKTFGDGIGNFLDLDTVIKASQAISGEIHFEKLLEKMMKILLENAGAERGFFLLKEKEKWFVKAEGNANTETISLLDAIPLEGNINLCASIVNYVVHTKQIILLNDASKKGIFVNDGYIKLKQPKSILCYPVINQGNLLCVVYLENNLSTDAFTSDRIKILNILSSQIALSVENSLLYSNLESKVAERTHDLKDTLENLRITQNELIQSEKMAALGQLIAGVGHEINTPIGAINSSMQSVQGFLDKDFISVLEYFIQAKPEERSFMQTMLNRQALNKTFISSKDKRQIKIRLEKIISDYKIKDASTMADHLVDIGVYEDIEEFLPILRDSGIFLLEKIYKLSILRRGLSNIQLAAEKTSKIVYALKSYSHKESTSFKTKARINIGMDTVLTLYQNVINRGIELTKEYDEEIPEIECYPDELNQVWVNLIQNSIHAMDSKGKLTICIKKENSNLRVDIIDNGKGIPIEVQSKIFQPFFTTKPAGEGSGLGLGIVEKILEKHEGKISFESEPGKTRFTILLPIK